MDTEWGLDRIGGAGDGVCSDWDHQEWDVTSLIWADRQLQLTEGEQQPYNNCTQQTITSLDTCWNTNPIQRNVDS